MPYWPPISLALVMFQRAKCFYLLYFYTILHKIINTHAGPKCKLVSLVAELVISPLHAYVTLFLFMVAQCITRRHSQPWPLYFARVRAAVTSIGLAA